MITIEQLQEENHELRVKNKNLQGLVDTLSNQLTTLISNSYSLIKKAQSDTATSIYHILYETCQRFFIKDENNEE